ncbi:hypothetical protein BDV19DRAFT_216905 [Aspergillus venezuelensis]
MVSIDPVWTSLGLIRRRDIIICPRIRQLSSISLGLISLLRIVTLAFIRTGVSRPSVWLEPLSQRCEIHWGLRMLSLCSILKYLSKTMLSIMTRVISISRYFRKRKPITRRIRTSPNQTNDPKKKSSKSSGGDSNTTGFIEPRWTVHFCGVSHVFPAW